MCGTCGCSDPKNNVTLTDPETGKMTVLRQGTNLGEEVGSAHVHDHGHDHDDKPLKYPHMFRAAELVLINKIDLAPHVDFDEARCRENIAASNSDARVITVSAKTGAGVSDWIEFITGSCQ